MLHARRSREEEQIKTRVDPVSGQPARNPYDKPVDLASQAAVRAADPQLAAHLERLAKDGGPSYYFLAQKKDEAAGQARLRGLVYGADEHRKNPYVAGTLTERGAFEKSHDPAVVAFFKREALTPVRFPWQPPVNLTELGRIGKADPTLRQLIARGAEIEQEWLSADLAKLQATEKSLAQEKRNLELMAGR